MSLIPAAGVPEPLAEWLEPGLRELAGQDPLGIQTITTDRILPALLPGVLALSRRARYFSIYSFLIRRFEESASGATNQDLDEFIRHREFELGVAANLCPRCGGDSAIGNRTVRPLVAQSPARYARERSVKSALGGYGLYYRSPMEELGLVVPAGMGYVNDEPTPVDLLAPTPRAQGLADAFEAAIAGTRWYGEWMHGIDPIPAEVLEELSAVACLCRLDDWPEEQQKVRDAMLTAPSPERAEPTEQRRRAFALLLDLMQERPDVADSDQDFRNVVIRRFYENPRANDARGSTTAQWAGTAMRETLQDALSVIWLDFCRAGLRTQSFDGLTRAQLRQLVEDELVGGGELRLGELALPTAAHDSLADWRARGARACAGLGWQELSVRAIEADNALTGLAVLLALADRVPDASEASDAWADVARVDGEHQPGLLHMASMLKRGASESATVAELMLWVVDRFVVRVHETVAMGKLPESTFRFSWEQGRLRFVDNGVWRFEASGLRRDALSYIAYDLGWWTLDGTETPSVTDAGADVIEKVFGP